MAHAPAAAAVVPQRRPSLTPPSPSPLPAPPTCDFPPLLAAPLMGKQLTDAQRAEEPVPVMDAEAEFQDLAQSILKALEADEEWEPSLAVAPVDSLPSAMPGSPKSGRSLASLFGMDRVFLDILGDLNPTAC
eukprot:EG_transcript_19513